MKREKNYEEIQKLTLEIEEFTREITKNKVN